VGDGLKNLALKACYGYNVRITVVTRWERCLTQRTRGVGEGAKVTVKLCERRASMYSLGFSLCLSSTCRVHILHSACLLAGQLITRQLMNLQHCYTNFGHRAVVGRTIPHAALGSARPRDTACIGGSSPHRQSPSRHCPMDDHPFRVASRDKNQSGACGIIHVHYIPEPVAIRNPPVPWEDGMVWQ